MLIGPRSPGSPPRSRRSRRLPELVSAFAVCWACGDATPRLDYEILTTFPHDTAAYTQGLLFHGGHLFESAGRYGVSNVRKVDVRTGRVVASVAVDSMYFAEGLALVGSELIQLTWKEGLAFVYDVETLEPIREHRYEGEGWGLCYDGASLYMSDGSSTLQVRDPGSFEVTAEIPVKEAGRDLSLLNELECVGDLIYANVFQSNRIVQIDKRSGRVVGEIDGFQITLVAGAPRDPAAVLNGIAYIPETGVLLLTGKLWPKVLAVRLAERVP